MHERPDFSGKAEIIKFISENNIRILNLCHIPEEGRLKTLSFSVADKDRVNEILEFGERVDGSSLFSSIEPGKSDIYIMPRISRVFINPFATLPTLSVLCDYLDENGKPLDITPKNVLLKAGEKLRSSTGTALKALAELEFYVIAKRQSGMLFLGTPDMNYHESAPFTQFEDLRNEVLAILGTLGIRTKYGHSEVGRIAGNDNTLMEQHEIEFMPENMVEMAETIAIAKWVIRNICERRGVTASFIPKIDLAHAGTGMHIHMCAVRNGKNIVSNADRTLSSEALKIIGGMLKLAPGLAAFGNPTPVSYLRFIAPKETPMYVSWSARNRLALIRIPLWWSFKKQRGKSESCRETFEYRAPDAFANAYLLFAGLTTAANYGLKNSEEALKIAENLHVETTGGKPKKLKSLPSSCNEAAENLRKDRKLYEADGVFPKKLIDNLLRKLEAYDDRNLWTGLSGKPEEIEKILMQYLHYG